MKEKLELLHRLVGESTSQGMPLVRNVQGLYLVSASWEQGRR